MYRTYNWSAWSPTQTLVANLAQDVSPSAAQLKNGTLYVSFTSNRTGNFDIFLKHYSPGYGWSPDQQITWNKGDDIVSSLVASSDGSLQVFWDRQNSTAKNIFYKTYRNGAWSPEVPLTTDLNPILNQQPTAFQMKDGRIWAAWSSVQGPNFTKVNILYRIFNGALGTWTNTAPLTSFGSDRQPALSQDANLTIWAMWTRELSCGAKCFQDDLFYKTSGDNGVTWSSETNLTNDAGCADPNCPDDDTPSPAQLRDGRMWVFWTSLTFFGALAALCFTISFFMLVFATWNCNGNPVPDCNPHRAFGLRVGSCFPDRCPFDDGGDSAGETREEAVNRPKLPGPF